MSDMTQIRIKDAAQFLDVSDDTVRRWIDAGIISATTDEKGRKVIDGKDLAEFAKEQAVAPPSPLSSATSARNRLVGLVTNVISDKVMSQVELQCGPFRVVSLMSTEAVNQLGLELGVVAVATVKATMVVVETPLD
ncbi:helix-turn-helix transcriptional regulator [Actinomycetaceae bacterium MB13-C1-2]|nr:helix-turn-helix transcriptional regulator [Actinomycetaceae bacterium MB13-C1-2]